MTPPRKLLVLAFALLSPGLIAAADPPAAEAPPKAEAAAPAAEQAAADAAATDEVSIEDIRVFTAVFREVQRSYVEPVSAEHGSTLARLSELFSLRMSGICPANLAAPASKKPSGAA